MADVGVGRCLCGRHPLDSLRLEVLHVHLEGEVKMLSGVHSVLCVWPFFLSQSNLSSFCVLSHTKLLSFLWSDTNIFVSFFCRTPTVYRLISSHTTIVFF